MSVRLCLHMFAQVSNKLRALLHASTRQAVQSYAWSVKAPDQPAHAQIRHALLRHREATESALCVCSRPASIFHAPIANAQAVSSSVHCANGRHANGTAPTECQQRCGFLQAMHLGSYHEGEGFLPYSTRDKVPLPLGGRAGLHGRSLGTPASPCPWRCLCGPLHISSA